MVQCSTTRWCSFGCFFLFLVYLRITFGCFLVWCDSVTSFDFMTIGSISCLCELCMEYEFDLRYGTLFSMHDVMVCFVGNM